MFNALASFLKAENFDGKREFILAHDGLAFLASLVSQPFSLKLNKKVLSLVYDFVLNDEGIFLKNPRCVRFHFATINNIDSLV